MSQTKYRLSFVANTPALGMVSYTVKALWESETPRETVHSAVKIYNHFGEVHAPIGFKPETSPSSSEFTLQNARIIALRTGINTVPVHLDFAKYGVRIRPNSERSGAYLFLPDGDAVPLQLENLIVNVIEGPIMSSVFVQLPFVQHTATLYRADGLLNIVDIEKTNNFELIMRLSTNINSSDEFFTDVNGYQATVENRPAGFPSLSAYVASQSLLNSMVRLLRVEDEDKISNGAFTSVDQEFGVYFAMPTLKTHVYVKGSFFHIGLVIHRQFLEICFSSRSTLNISSLIQLDPSKKLYRSSLSFSLVKNEVDGKGNLPVCPMEMQAFIL